MVNETTSQELIMTKVIEPWMEEAACYFLFRKEGRYSSVEEIKELAQDIADCMPEKEGQ